MLRVLDKNGNVKTVTTTITVGETDPIWLADKPNYLLTTTATATYALLGHTHSFASLTAKPTTMLGYGLNVDGVTITGTGTIGDPLVGASSFALTDGKGTTANGTAVDWGGTIAGPVQIVSLSYPGGLFEMDTAGYIKFGDVPGLANGTSIEVNDTTSVIRVDATNAYINNIKYPTADGTIGQVMTTDGAGELSLQDIPPLTNGSGTTVNGTAIDLGGLLTDEVLITSTSYPGQLFRIYQAGQVGLGDLGGSGNGTRLYIDDVFETIEIDGLNVTINSIKYPTADGTAGQAIVTSGAGVLSFATITPNATHTGDATGATALTVVAINGTTLSGLATGILKNTTGTGVPSIAVAGDFPTLNQNTTGYAKDVKSGGYQFLGSTIVGQNVNGDLASSTTGVAMASGRVYGALIYIDRDRTLTGLRFKQITQGNYTGSASSKVGLYTYNGSGTLTLVASSADDATLFKVAANTMGTKAFSSPYVATAGYYFAAVVWTSSATTTSPALGILNAANGTSSILDYTNGAKMFWYLSGQNDLTTPITISTTTAQYAEFWMGVY